jgi:hypothetical protein
MQSEIKKENTGGGVSVGLIITLFYLLALGFIAWSCNSLNSKLL